jgi:ubiquinone/menaquinone biosynthesis C-methylase UbiE/predicted transcriptional regulator
MWKEVLMDELLAGLKAVAETTRLRILFVLSQGELNVTELTYVLGQSQPRVSRHLKLMAESGLISRHKEGNWVLFRMREEGRSGALSKALVELLPDSDSLLASDMARLEEVRRQRTEIASAYFNASAADWEKLRSLHVLEADVEAAMLALLSNDKFETVVDLGTGTGRVLELLNDRAVHLYGLDTNREMLAIARANIEKKNMRNAQVRQADIYALPFADGFADLVVIHQVLHFLDEPQRALLEARRILAPKGKLVIVDFAPHDMEELRVAHAHRRLGLASEHMVSWLNRADLELVKHEVLPPPWLKSKKGLTVSIWLAANSALAAERKSEVQKLVHHS